MGSPRLNPETKAKAAAMLEIGFSQQATAEALGISLTSVRRIRGEVIPGAKQEELKEAALQTLLTALDNDFIKQQVCALVVDDLALGRRLRSNLAQLLDDLEKAPAKDLKSIGMKARSACQISQANKTNSDSLRQVLGLGNSGTDLEELPELVVREMLGSEVEALRQKQEEEARALGLLSSD